jgi:myotubularin-related protein 1/2
MHGFAVLIEKDWVHFGHQFAVRNGIANQNEKERSPIFIQFLDTVHQIFNQYPTAFEFNLEYLRELSYLSYTGVFGNLICDNMTVFFSWFI